MNRFLFLLVCATCALPATCAVTTERGKCLKICIEEYRKCRQAGKSVPLCFNLRRKCEKKCPRTCSGSCNYQFAVCRAVPSFCQENLGLCLLKCCDESFRKCRTESGLTLLEFSTPCYNAYMQCREDTRPPSLLDQIASPSKPAHSNNSGSLLQHLSKPGDSSEAAPSGNLLDQLSDPGNNSKPSRPGSLLE